MTDYKPIVFFILYTLLTFSVSNNLLAANRVEDPLVKIHDTIADPGEMLLQVDALNFIDDNGQVAAITLRIEIDTFLVKFIGIQNVTIAGNWLANYNIIQNEISIIFTAPYGTGYDINGKLFDLNLEYIGGFPAKLDFKAGCEISNSNLITIQGVNYENGTINQIPAVGTVLQDTVISYYNQTFNMPVMAVGSSYDMIDQISLRIGYDTTQLIYEGFVEDALTGISVVKIDSILTIDWADAQSAIDFTTLDTLVNLQFHFIGDSNQTIPFLTGSQVFNNGIIVASDFVNGYVRAKFRVELLNNPDSAGTVLGEGYYFIGDLVTVTAIPEDGFHFNNWTKNGNVVSMDSLYSYVKQVSNDTLTANYELNSYELFLVPSPAYGGEVIGAGVYQYGEVVSALAAPFDGYEFAYWMFGNDIISDDSLYTFTMPYNNLELIASFDTINYTVDVASNNIDFGIVEGGGIYNFWDTAVVIAIPSPAYKFVVWTEDGQLVSYEPIFSFPVNSNVSLIAEFQLDTECSAPVGLHADNLSETQAELSWLSSGDENEWELLWGETGFDTISGGELIEGLTELYYVLENLNPGTTYDFYVRAVCSDQVHSILAGPKTFSTWFVGIKAHENINLFKVFPNPTKNVLNIVFNKRTTGSMSYKIINLVGLVEIEGEFQEQDNYTINLESLPLGIYIIQLFDNDRMATEYFIKK